ncbi:SNF2-related protein [Sphingosinicella sp. YJ22]|uniref:SNF2-related protein n=1 Tax=Sphingosinicella sp. YJ22 TaxID=1104780 RepID=UPI00325FD0D4
MRRRVEAAGLAIGGALGVAAEPYPHQVAAVRRVLTDTQVRHLLADEVGLGKTVQALMILNALRWQNPAHKAVILLPNRLIDQWRRECWTRGHCKVSVFGEDAQRDDEAWVRLVRPQSIRSGEFRLQPERFDLLVVDEPQLIPAEVMEIVERTAGDFRQFLLLSATPGLGDPAKLRRIMAMLEPDRAAIASAKAHDLPALLDDIEASAAEGEHGNSMLPDTVWRTFSISRRILRSTRAEWGRYLPQRRYDHVSVGPLASERERVTLGMDWVGNVRQQGARTDTWRAAQVIHRGAASTRAYASGQADATGLLARAAAAGAGVPGDSRLDALLDILCGIWHQDADEQVIIVAGDNPSIDFLKPRLARYFGGDSRSLPMAELRREGEASDSEEADIRAMDAQLAAFARGEARVMLLGEWVQAGLNLHHFARNIIFYATPWDSDVVDQLIGRLDRLRPNGLWRGDQGRHFGRIRVWTISQEGTAEERVLAGLEALGVFERPLPPLSPEDALTIDGELKGLAFTGERDPVRRLSAMAAGWNGTGLQSRLSRFSPYSAAAAQALYDGLQTSPMPGPLVRSTVEADTFTSASERALRGWLTLIERSDTFAVDHRRDRLDPDVRFMTIWYRSKPAMFDPFQIAGVEGNNWMTGHVPFITARRHLAQPPRMTVNTDEGEEGGRPLRFLDHGDEVHDSLVDGFLSYAGTNCSPSQPQPLQVALDPRHPLLATCSGKVLALAAGWSDPGELAMPAFNSETLGRMATAPTEAQRAALAGDVRRAADWWLADQRWLRDHISARSYYTALVRSENGWTRLPDEIARLAFMPVPDLPDSRPARLRGTPPRLAPADVQAACRRALGCIVEQANGARDEALGAFQEALASRIQVVTVEGGDIIAAKEAALERLRSERTSVQDWAREGQIAAAKRSLEMARTAVSQRLAWLEAMPEKIAEMTPRILGVVIMRAAPFSDEC